MKMMIEHGFKPLNFMTGEGKRLGPEEQGASKVEETTTDSVVRRNCAWFYWLNIVNNRRTVIDRITG